MRCGFDEALLSFRSWGELLTEARYARNREGGDPNRFPPWISQKKREVTTLCYFDDSMSNMLPRKRISNGVDGVFG